MKEVTFTNGKGEEFFIQAVLPAEHSSIEEVAEAHVPVLLCVHGAGMSSDNFLLLSRELSLPSDEETLFLFRGNSLPAGAASAWPSDVLPADPTTLPSYIGDCGRTAARSPPRGLANGISSSFGVSPFLSLPRSDEPKGMANTASRGTIPARPLVYPLPLPPRRDDADLGQPPQEGAGSSFPGPPPRRPILCPPPRTKREEGSHEDGECSPAVPTKVVSHEVGERQHTDKCASSVSSGRSSSLSSSSSSVLEVCTVMYDMRCHGRSTYAGGEGSLTLEVLVDDFLSILQYVMEELFPSSLVFVMGHSLGAAVVAQGLGGTTVKWSPRTPVGGVVLLDAVEGTAKTSIQYMHDFLQHRPEEFSSVKEAEKWFLHHGGMRTVEGAAISVPPLLRCVGRLPASMQEGENHAVRTPQDKGGESDNESMGPPGVKYVWRSHLPSMEAVWNTWFDNLDSNFLRIGSPKMLCVASVDRLDRDLTVAHMQGKFQLEVCGNHAGHYIQDDTPAALADKLRRFIKRTLDVQKILKGTGSGSAFPLACADTSPLAFASGANTTEN